MKDYSYYSAFELTQDEDFVRWVKNPKKDPLIADQWNAWLQQHPEKKDIVDEARQVILGVTNEKQYLLEETKEKNLWSRIEDTIQETEQQTQVRHQIISKPWFRIAATITALLIFSVWYLVKENGLPLVEKRWPYQERGQLLKVSNASNKMHVVVLEDGSKISLQPHSTLEYPEKFSQTKRMVYLEGEAFFEIARNPQKPFSVHSSGLVTQVLGTSFTIRAFEEEKDIIVAVRTGKVSVFRESEQNSDDVTNPSSAELLTPNQKIVFSKNESRMVKTLVDNPTMMPQAEGKNKFNFKDTPIREVITALEESYGVDIVFDQEVLSDCYLNASVEGLPFYDQLRLICKVINAEYQIIDGHIIITGTGCS